MSTLRLGVSLQPRWPRADATAALRAASHAEVLGLDHVAVGNRLLDSGFGLDADPLVLLSAVSAATRRLRLLTSVLVAPYYPALMLANQAATLDVISGGRLILGVGTGWNPDEFAALGVSRQERGARTDDQLADNLAAASHPRCTQNRAQMAWRLRSMMLAEAPASQVPIPIYLQTRCSNTMCQNQVKTRAQYCPRCGQRIMRPAV